MYRACIICLCTLFCYNITSHTEALSHSISDVISIHFVLWGTLLGWGIKACCTFLCHIFCFIWFLILVSQNQAWLFMVHLCIHANQHNDVTWWSWSHYWHFMRGIQWWPRNDNSHILLFLFYGYSVYQHYQWRCHIQHRYFLHKCNVRFGINTICPCPLIKHSINLLRFPSPICIFDLPLVPLAGWIIWTF